MEIDRLMAKVIELESRLALAKRGLHVISLHYGTDKLADHYLKALDADVREIPLYE